MKKTLLAIALSFAIPAAIAVGLGSQAEASPYRGPFVDRLAQKLDLTDQQKTQLKAIFAEQREKRRALREEKRARMQEVLTPEQLTEWDEMRQRRKGRHGRKFCNKAQRQIQQ
jgi:protein CpxP